MFITVVLCGRHGDYDLNFNLTGLVDEVKIWNAVRTTSGIAIN